MTADQAVQENTEGYKWEGVREGLQYMVLEGTKQSGWFSYPISSSEEE